MAYYTTYGEFQKQMKEHYLRTGSLMQFAEITTYMYNKGLFLEEPPTDQITTNLFESMTDDEFNEIIDATLFTFTPNLTLLQEVKEGDIIPGSRDVFVIRHPRYTRPVLHSHNYFEIEFVASGTCTLMFEDTTRSLREGEMCVIAPSSKHDIVIHDDSTVFTIMLRKSTFNTTFFSLMSQKNLLSYFFRTLLQDESHSNYLLFYVEDTGQIKNLIRRLMMESYKNDTYSNSCSINYVNLIFSEVLRNYSKTVQFYNYQMGTDFSLILQYIQHNYKTLTLSSLAELFHYSEPHLSTLIKQNTGLNYTTLIKKLRLADAVELLLNTDQKIGEIAERVGYNSADHFSRLFRATYKMPPLEYRKLHSNNSDSFDPFSFEE